LKEYKEELINLYTGGKAGTLRHSRKSVKGEEKGEIYFRSNHRRKGDSLPLVIKKDPKLPEEK